MNIENINRCILLMDSVDKEQFNMTNWIRPTDKKANFAGHVLLSGLVEGIEIARYNDPNTYSRSPIVGFYNKLENDWVDGLTDYVVLMGKFLGIDPRVAFTLLAVSNYKTFDWDTLYNVDSRIKISNTDVMKALIVLIKNEGEFKGNTIVSISDEELQEYVASIKSTNLSTKEKDLL